MSLRRFGMCLALTALMAIVAGHAGYLVALQTASANAFVDEEEEEEEEEAPAKTPPKKPKATSGEEEEEEEVGPGRATEPIRVGAPVNLVEEAKKAPPELQPILREFAQVYDTVTTVNHKTYKVEPLPVRYDPNGPGMLVFRVIGEKASGRHSLPRNAVLEVTHYELRAQRAVQDFLNRALAKTETPGYRGPSRFQILRTAEMVLSHVLRFHRSAKENNVRHVAKNGKQPNTWGDLEGELQREIRRLRIDQVRALTVDRNWKAAASLAHQLHVRDRGDREILNALEAIYLGQAEEAIRRGKYPLARRHMEYFLKNYNSEISPAIANLQKRLADRARDLLRQSEALAKQGKASRAIALLEQAEQIWPRLPRLALARRQILQSYPILRIGVRRLPNQISPTTATSDTDRLAVHLVYDNLFELVSGPSARHGYVCKLGADIVPVPRGWEIVLPHDIKWSDGRPFSAKDIVRSAEILMDPRCPYYDPLAREILQVKEVDPYRVRLTFARAVADPLSFLTFPLLPLHLMERTRSPINLSLGKRPIGTGPFMFRGVEDNEAVFVANPHYHRPHAPDGPHIREIRLVQYTDFAAGRQALANGSVQLLLDLTSSEAAQLSGMRSVTVKTPTQPDDPIQPYFANPSVYWLMPNCRKPALANSDFRTAISYAIDREAILNKLFRSRERKYHQILNGPFPLGCWAYNPDYHPDKDSPFKPAEAKGYLNTASTRVGSVSQLLLKYAREDVTAAPACAEIAKQLEQRLGLRLQVQGVPMEQLAAELRQQRASFDLLYWRHDFPTESVDLWPFFDPNGIGPAGRNFMGFRGDSEVDGKFREVQSRREFASLRSQMHRLHDLLIRRMIPIPLWQIDRHVAIHRNLRVTRIHPVWAVDGIELWELRAQ